MSLPKQLLVFILFILCWSCNRGNKYPYAIKDFRKALQPYLTKIVEKGIVMHFDSALHNMATDKELVRLGQSEHPILRSTAFWEMLQRKSFNHFDVLMGHLDDTAHVLVDYGEFGFRDMTVSDDILDRAKWKTEQALAATIDEVISKHNYLASAYLVLNKIKPQEKYYPIIRDMALRPRRIDDIYHFETGFPDIEYALYGLAKFKKKGDVTMIKTKLLSHVYELGEVSFKLMKEYPDTAYLEVLNKYHRENFYRSLGTQLHGFTGSEKFRAEPKDFIEALAQQENTASAKLLDTILKRLPYYKDRYGNNEAEFDVIDIVWKHPSPVYAQLREKIKTKAEEQLKNRLFIPIERHKITVDTAEENYRWWP